MNVLHCKISYKLIQICFLFFFSIRNYPYKKLLNHEYYKVFLYAKIKIKCIIVKKKKKPGVPNSASDSATDFKVT